MKKITFILLVLISILPLFACNNKDDAAFKKCLDETKPINAATIDNLFAESTNTQLPDNLFSTLLIDNIKMDIKEDDVSGEIYVWQEQSRIYLTQRSQEESTMESNYLDLAELEAMYDEAKNNQAALPTKPSELYETIVKEYGNAEGSESSIFAKRTLDELLEIFNYKYEDFNKVEEGKYVVKDEVLYSKILKWSVEEMTVEQFIELLTQSKSEFKLYAYFDGTRITAYEVVIKNTEEEVTQEIKLKLSFLYNETDFIGLKIEANIKENIDTTEISFEIKVFEESLIVNLEVNVPNIQKITVNLTLSNGSLALTIINNEIVLFDINLKCNITKDQHNTKISLSGSAVFGEVSMTITSGSNVVIPNDVKANKDKATNILASNQDQLNIIH